MNEPMREAMNSKLRRFVGWLSGDVPELHNVEVPRLAESLERFLVADSAGSGEPQQDRPSSGERSTRTDPDEATVPPSVPVAPPHTKGTSYSETAKFMAIVAQAFTDPFPDQPYDWSQVNWSQHAAALRELAVLVRRIVEAADEGNRAGMTTDIHAAATMRAFEDNELREVAGLIQAGFHVPSGAVGK